MQVITIAGNIGSDAVTKDFADNVAVNFTVAVNERTAKGETTTWYNVVIWRKKDTAGKLLPHLTKGTSITLMGKPQVQVWDAEGKSHGRIRITCDNFKLQGSPIQLSSPPEEGQSESDDLPF